MNRKAFLKKVSILALTLVIPKFILAKPWWKKKRTISVLHTNDFHSRIEPFPANHPKYPNQGGIAKLFTLIQNKIAQNSNYILVDSGDIVQGTPYFNIFKGEVEIKWMNKAGYHAATIGNHDFDNGIEGLAKIIKLANFPFVNCNYNFNNTILKELVKPYHIIQVNHRKVGIIGVGIDPVGLIPPTLCENIVYTEPIEKANFYANVLHKTKKCDLIILLSHLGYQNEGTKIDDLKLAAKSKNIHAILGAHTHTFLTKPTTVLNSVNKPVQITQAGWAGLQLGQLIFEL